MTCQVWPSGQPIKLQVKRWLEIAGVDLETENTGTTPSVEQYPGDINVGRYERYRASGANILMDLEYDNTEGYSVDREGYSASITVGTPVCTLWVNGIPGWASRGSEVTYESYDNITGEGMTLGVASKYHDRYKRGISFSFSATGRIGIADPMAMFNAFISATVILTIVPIIVGMFAFSGKGAATKMYKNNAKVPLHYKNALHKNAMSIILASAQWDSLMEGEDDKVKARTLAKHLHRAGRSTW